MQNPFQIFDLPAGAGTLGICPLPGRDGNYESDLLTVQNWAPALVLSMTEQHEMDAVNAGNFGADLMADAIKWHHLPITDYGAPDAEIRAHWDIISPQAQKLLNDGAKLLVHCKGGCGRSGMILLRLMVELGESPDAALHRLRNARPCAVETDAQLEWASQPASSSS
jgi:protein-tyrosine phosphatase